MAFLIVKKSPKGTQEKPLMVVVSKKVSKKATERNLIKRRLRNIAKPFLIETNKDIKIITKPGTAKASFEELKEEFLSKISN